MIEGLGLGGRALPPPPRPPDSAPQAVSATAAARKAGERQEQRPQWLAPAVDEREEEGAPRSDQEHVDATPTRLSIAEALAAIQGENPRLHRPPLLQGREMIDVAEIARWIVASPSAALAAQARLRPDQIRRLIERGG